MIDLHLIQQLVQSSDPVQTAVDALMTEAWTSNRWQAAQQAGDIARYLIEGEHQASEIEHAIYSIYADLYALLENDVSRQPRVETLIATEPYTLLLIDALSLREAPLVLERLARYGCDAALQTAWVQPPTETVAFTRMHLQASGPSDIAARFDRQPFAFRHVTAEDWMPDFAVSERQRFIWYAFPDNYFHLKETAYDRHVVQPITAILDAVLGDPGLVRPLVITGDHGYLWQGGHCPWPVEDPREADLLADAFKHGRSTTAATQALADTGKAWVQGNAGAARGRFDWGGRVKGAGSLFKHGGVSLMECVIPWIIVQ